MRPFLLLGEAPNAATAGVPRLWLRPDESGIPHSANRLLAHSGLELRQFLRIFDRDNLVHELPAVSGKGRAFPVAFARTQVPRIFGDWDLSRLGLVMLGRRVSKCFRWRRRVRDKREGTILGDAVPWVPYFQWHYVEESRRDDACRIDAAVVPHPSGLNRLWNDESVQQEARRFFANVAELARVVT